MSELDPLVVARRLEQLRELYVPETVEEGRRRLEADQPASRESFDQAVARRLAELRALCELTRVIGGVAAPIANRSSGVPDFFRSINNE